jgi:hypothetical protein
MRKHFFTALALSALVMFTSCGKNNGGDSSSADRYTMLSSQVQSAKSGSAFTQSGDFLYLQCFGQTEYDLKNDKLIDINGGGWNTNVLDGKIYSVTGVNQGSHRTESIVCTDIDTGDTETLYSYSFNLGQGGLNQFEMAEDGTMFFIEDESKGDFEENNQVPENTFYMLSSDGKTQTKLAENIHKYYISGDGFYFSKLDSDERCANLFYADFDTLVEQSLDIKIDLSRDDADGNWSECFYVYGEKLYYVGYSPQLYAYDISTKQTEKILSIADGTHFCEFEMFGDKLCARLKISPQNDSDEVWHESLVLIDLQSGEQTLIHEDTGKTESDYINNSTASIDDYYVSPSGDFIALLLWVTDFDENGSQLDCHCEYKLYNKDGTFKDVETITQDGYTQ